ncbi:MAG: hybrid sensor histidine kinase/response regulator, partial [Hyphomicrobiales bacterium]|nr:hybrid sensor histidine kinase/response regulator [Hyphomicrobiales bacterium]
MHKDIAEAHFVGQRPFKRLRSWPSSLNLLTISAILVPLAFFALGAVASWRAVNAEARSGIERTTDLLHEHALRSFETHEAVLTAVDQRILGMSWSDIRENTDVAAFLTALVKSAGPLAGILVADPDDKVAAASFALPQTPIDLSPLDFVRPRQADGAKSYVGPLIRQRADGTVTFPVARRRTTLEDHYDGMIASFLSPAYFETFYQHLNNRSGDLIALIRDDGTILAHSPHLPANDEIGAASQQRNPGISASDGAILVRSPLDGIERYISTRRVGDYPVFVRHGRSLRSVQEQWLTRFAPFGLLCLAAMGLLSLLTWRTSVATARERDARARLAVEEARHAADAENTARVSRLMETNVFGVTSCSTDGIIEANDAFLKMVDLTRDQFEANGFDWKAATVGADIAMEAHAQAEIMANGACRPYEREFLLPSGKTVPVMIGATLYERQPLVWICFLLDLTERREREAQQLFVMRELNHRTKNLLTVIRSIA